MNKENWIEKRHKILVKEFGAREFTYDEANKVLEHDDKSGVLAILSALRKQNKLTVTADEKDARKKIYRLMDKAEPAFPDEKNGKVSRDDLIRILKKAADLIRTSVDYKFILVLLFLKRISDKWQVEYEQEYKIAKKDGFSDKEAREEAKNQAYHDFILPEEFLGNHMNVWDNIRSDVSALPENLTKVMKKIGDLNPKVKDVVAETSFVAFTNNRENLELLRQLFELFSERRLDDVPPDILGDAYEWLMLYFAPSKAKEGEIFTPKEIIRLLVEILEPKPEEEIYDPASGSGGMLIGAYKYGVEKYKDRVKTMVFYGEERGGSIIALAQMNMYIHGIKQATLIQGDTLLYPKFEDKSGPKKFDVVIANPPWNQDGYAEDVLKKGNHWQKRFEYGFPPNQSADWAWIQHMFASAKDKKGRVGVVLDSGALFRGGKEGEIRKKFIENDFIDSVILLPEKLFYNTGAPGIIMILSRNKSAERKGKILLINASREFGKHEDVRKLNQLKEKNLKNIVSAHHEFSNKKEFSRAIAKSEIEKNGWLLNVTMYVSKEEEVEDIDIPAVWDEIKGLDKQLAEKEKKIEGYLKEIK